LRCSNLKEYKYDWYWKKSRPGGFVNAKLRPLKDVETISVFSNGMAANGSSNNMPYYPQGLVDCDVVLKRKNANISTSAVSPSRKSFLAERKITKTNYPKQILEFANPNSKMLHPTQKPIDLLEYLIKTYTLENEIVLDNTMGSGSTGVACVITDRKFIGIERDKTYFDIASKRINDEYDKYNLDME
jgi:site-specific DNA-methyltransferase (adenine-specific)